MVMMCRTTTMKSTHDDNDENTDNDDDEDEGRDDHSEAEDSVEEGVYYDADERENSWCYAGVDDDGNPYEWNERTGETRWKSSSTMRPAPMRAAGCSCSYHHLKARCTRCCHGFNALAAIRSAS